jgi:hypothetical protein
MQALTDEETLIVAIATSTCFLYRLASRTSTARVSHEDLVAYVDHLIRIYSIKPDAKYESENARDMRGAVEFCIEQLREVAADQATKLACILKPT